MAGRIYWIDLDAPSVPRRKARGGVAVAVAALCALAVAGWAFVGADGKAAAELEVTPRAASSPGVNLLV